uniref:NADH dehydrogenase subunit 2 n=1 Tax=Trichomalopsis sarcophagae TaxID=543379 RepID=UPI00218246A3|nr:NADH dehydrogenase subunit 2 [Trichomalopsis sarcophagae]UVN15273.1 NADH dehydrogenase subunit 2 [Trichomalopsis sarcophagae]
MNYYCYVFIIPILMISNLMIFISSSWISMWMIMEINLISFISLIIFDKNMNKELYINYFLIQTFNSYLFLMASLLLEYNFIQNIITLMVLSMINKMGFPPFYYWYLKIMNNMNWINIFLMSTVQKIIPLIILSNMMNNKFSMLFTMIIMMFTSIYSSIKGLSQMNLKFIYCYSSMIQMSWVIILMIFNEMMMMNYLLIYFIISLSMCMVFNNYNINNLINISMLKFNNIIIYYFMNFSIFSLASIPPMFGFMMKLMLMKELFNLLPVLMLIIMIMGSLISMFFYLRLLFMNIMVNSFSNKINYKFINYNNNYNFKILFMLWMMMVLLMSMELF